MQGFTSVKIPVLHTAFETTAASASGISASLKAQGKDKEITVLAWAGDGGTADIGIQGLSGAAERREDFIYACYDNEAYMNTGTQRSGSTPWGAKTTTTPYGKTSNQKEYAKKFWLLMIYPMWRPVVLHFHRIYLRNFKKRKKCGEWVCDIFKS